MSDFIKGQVEDSYELTPSNTYSDLPRSTLPAQIDNIDEMQDLTADLLDLQKQFYNLVNAGNLAGAKELLNNNPKLEPCLFNADKYNSLRDTIVALQRIYLKDIQDYIMNISQPKGEGKENEVYKKYDVVSYIYEDATQFYCARVLQVNDVTTPPPANPDEGTPVTLRGMRGHTGLGLTPSGGGSETEQYYNFVDEDGIPHVSMIYYDNMFGVATRNNINSKPTGTVTATEDAYSTNEDWEIILALRQTADGIVFPDRKSLTKIREEWDAKLRDWDDRTFENLESFISKEYTYHAIKESSDPIVWHEYAINNATNATYSEVISTKVSESEGNIQKICNSESHPINYTIRYIKDENGNGKGVKK